MVFLTKKSGKPSKKAKGPSESGAQTTKVDDKSTALAGTKPDATVSSAPAKKATRKPLNKAGSSKPAVKEKQKSIRAATAGAPTVVTPGTDKATKKQAKHSKKQTESFASALRVSSGFRLSELDAASTPAFEGGHKAAEKLMAKTAAELSDRQERLYAGQRHAGGQSLLLVVQGMDTSGKGGIMRHVVSMLDPQGVELTSFKAPTKEEQAHPFLWRIRNALPKPGFIGVFDRSQYEDVLVVRVHDLVARPVWMRRYGQINAFEEATAAKGTTIVKVMLHIDADEQKDRLAERLEDPAKYYKFNPGDLTERASWNDYQEAYQAVLERTSTSTAPWYVVPANHKWYARLAVQQLLLEHLRAMDLPWPAPAFDVEEQKRRLEQE